MEPNLKALLEETVEPLTDKDRERAHYNCLRWIFADVTGNDQLKQAVDLVHYRGGYPSENSPARASALGAMIGKTMSALTAGFRTDIVDEIITAAAAFGIKIEVASALPTSGDISDKTKDRIGKVLARYGNSAEVEEALKVPGNFVQRALEHGNDFQTRICQLADSVKLEMADRAEAEGIEKNFFRFAATMKHRIDRLEDEKKTDAVADLTDNLEKKAEILPHLQEMT